MSQLFPSNEALHKAGRDYLGIVKRIAEGSEVSVTKGILTIRCEGNILEFRPLDNSGGYETVINDCEVEDNMSLIHAFANGIGELVWAMRYPGSVMGDH